jgi:hypothetical protein
VARPLAPVTPVKPAAPTCSDLIRGAFARFGTVLSPPADRSQADLGPSDVETASATIDIQPVSPGIPAPAGRPESAWMTAQLDAISQEPPGTDDAPTRPLVVRLTVLDGELAGRSLDCACAVTPPFDDGLSATFWSAVAGDAPASALLKAAAFALGSTMAVKVEYWFVGGDDAHPMAFIREFAPGTSREGYRQ